MTFNLEEEYGLLLDLLENRISSDNLAHYGVKGMKWGVRKKRPTAEEVRSLGPDRITRKTSSGEEITLKKIPPNAIQRFIGRRSEKYRAEIAKSANLTIHDSSGKKVGDAAVYQKSAEELNLVWVGINRSSRGQGYATQAMEAAREFGERQGFKKLTLEVPGNSPDARHIYEKLGFKVTKEADDSDDVWGGLTEMVYDFDKVKHSQRRGTMTDNEEVEAFLAHYGVKGMKWGVRKDRSNTGGSSPRAERRQKRRQERAAANVVRTKARVQSRSVGVKRDNATIKGARAKLQKADADYEVRRAEARLAKQTAGKEAARKLIREAKLDREVSYILNEPQASMQTSEEFVMSIIADIGNIILGGRR